MRIILLMVASLVLASPTLAQTAPAPILPINTETHLVTYSEVVPVADVNQTELYLRVKLWTVSAYNSTKDVVQLDDKDAGIVVVRGIMSAPIKQYGFTNERNFRYVLRLAVKDGRYKYTLSEYELQFGGTTDYPTITYQPIEAQLTPAMRQNKKAEAVALQLEAAISAHAAKLTARLKEVMQKPATGKSDW